MIARADCLADQFDRLPPHDLDAEKCTLASLMISASESHALALQIRSMLTRDDFYSTDHQIIFDCVARMFDAGWPIDVVTLRAELIKHGMYEEVGGKEYLAAILSMMPAAAHGPHYAQIVKEKSLLRRSISIANDVLRDAYSPSHAADHGFEIAQRAIDSMAEIVNASSRTRFRTLTEIMPDVRKQIDAGGIGGISSGFASLDNVIGSLGPGELAIVAARPSMGKSTLLRQIALQNAVAGEPFAIVSLEESAMKIGRNLLSSTSGVENHRLRKGQFLHLEDWNAIDDGISKLNGLPLYVVDHARRIADIRATLNVLKARHGIRGFGLDYLGRVGVDGKSIYERVSNASLAISDLAKELDLPAVVLCQLNRGVEQRDDKRPGMADLRDSGSIEQDADVIIFLHREDYYRLADPKYDPTRVAELIVAKYRDGERGVTVKLHSNLAFQRFEEFDVEVPDGL